MRTLHLKEPRFSASLKAHAPVDSPACDAVMVVLGRLQADEQLPGPDDRIDRMPPNLPCLVRPVPEAGLLVCYAVRGPLLYALAVMREVKPVRR